MILRNCIVAIMLLFATSSWAQQRAIVILQVHEGYSFIAADLENLTYHMQDLYPEHRIVPLTVNSKLFGSDSKSIGRSLQSLIKDDFVITHLIISTHGMKFSRNTTYLKGLGTFSAKRQSSSFRNVFDPIRNHTANNLQIYFDSCLTFCGSDRDAAKKAEGLLGYFNAPNGSIFGASSILYTDSTPNSRPDLSYERKAPMLHILTQAAPEVILFSSAINLSMLGVGIYSFSSIANYADPSKWFLPSIMILTSSWGLQGAYSYIKQMKVLRNSSEHNKGRFFRLNNGSIERIENVEMPRDFKRFFDSNPNCTQYFL